MLLKGKEKSNTACGGKCGRHSGSLRGLKRNAACFMAALSVLTLSLPGTAFSAVTAPTAPADRGKTGAELNGYTEERWAELNDNTLNYEELHDLIHTFNPSISAAWAGFDSAITDMNTIGENLQSRKREMGILKDEAKTSGDGASYANYVMQEIILKKAAGAISDAKDLLSRPVTSSNRPLRQAEAQAVAGAQSLMISCASMEDRRQILSELVKMQQALYENAAARESAGTGTAADTLSAEVAVEKAEVQLSQIEDAEGKIKQSLILMCGWSADADPVIGEVPDANLSEIDSFDPDKDITAAIGNNYTLISFRNGEDRKSTASFQARDLNEQAMEDTLLSNLKSYYNDILESKAGLEAAEVGLQAAESQKTAADMQYGLGMITAAQYSGVIVSYVQGESALRTAQRTLFSAEETYRRALEGICPVGEYADKAAPDKSVKTKSRAHTSPGTLQ